jgi:hypothetical protein
MRVVLGGVEGVPVAFQSGGNMMTNLFRTHLAAHLNGKVGSLVFLLLLLFHGLAWGQRGPVLPVQTDRVVNELGTLVVTNTAYETNVPPDQLYTMVTVTNHYNFTYPNRDALLADGWSFMASKSGVTRNTEITNSAQGLMIDYNQSAHSHWVNVPSDVGDFFEINNNRNYPARNFLTRALPTNWVQINLSFWFAPGAYIQQAGLALYQDDDNYNLVTLGFAPWRPSHVLANGAMDVVSGGGDANDREAWVLESGGLLPQSVFSAVDCPHVHCFTWNTPMRVLRIDRWTSGVSNNCVQAWWNLSFDPNTWIAGFADVGEGNQLTGQFLPPQLTNPRIAIWTGCLPPAVPGAVSMNLYSLDVITRQAALQLTYSLLTAPAGATIDGTGVISWTPAQGQFPSTNLFTTVVTDNSVPPGSATNRFTVVVQDINVPPVLPAQADRILTLPATLTVTNTATEADPNSQSLTYQLLSGPLGATITTNGIITWTPGVAQQYTTNLFVTVVTDFDPLAANAQSLSATNSFQVVVLPSPYPVLPDQPNCTVPQFTTLTVTNTATDGALAVYRIVTNSIRFTYASRDALLADGWSFFGTNPEGSARNTETAAGAVVDYDQVAHPGALNIPCDVGDLYGTSASVNNTRNSLFRSLPPDWQTVRLALNFGPVSANYQQAHLGLYQDDNNYVQVGVGYNNTEHLTLDTEFGGSPNTVVTLPTTSTTVNFRFDRNPTNATVTAYYSFDGLNWAALGTVNLTLSNPRLMIWTGSYQFPYGLGGAVMGLQRLDIVGGAMVPVTLNYALFNPPAGASIDSNGIITWTPTTSNAPGLFVLTTVVTDNSQRPLGATNSFTVQVTPGRGGPFLPAQPDVTIDQYSTLWITNTALDTDIPFTGLTYRLADAPAGAAIDTNGVISWTPGPGQGYTSNLFTTHVTDGSTPPLSRSNSFQVVVNEINVPPVLPVLADRTALAGRTMIVTNTATEPDMPPTVLNYQLRGPTGSAIDENGIITWTPSQAQALQSYLFKTTVTDWNPWAVNNQYLTANNSFNVTVVVVPPAPTPTIRTVTLQPNQFVLSWDAAAYHSYRLQSCDNLSSNNWHDVGTALTADGDTLTVTNTMDSAPARFFRVLLLP